MNVLVVDDDPIMRRATTRMLPRHRVDGVEGVEEAFAAVESTQYDAIIVDACLGGSHEDRSGLELVRELRARGYDGGIVVVSGVVLEDLQAQAERAGADAALLKADYDGPMLRTAIDHAIAARAEPAVGSDDELPADLRGLAEDVLDAFAQQRALEAEQAYRLALLAKAAFASSALKGGKAIDVCARAVGLSRQTLQPYAIVATRWSAPELKRLLAERRNVHGEPISVSHLVMLAKLPREKRDAWIERVFREGLTVRQLRDILRAAAAAAGGTGTGAGGGGQ